MSGSEFTHKKDAEDKVAWYESATMEELTSLPYETILDRLNTSQTGLSSQEAENRLRIYGPNLLAKRKRRTGFVEFLYHLRNPLVFILLFAGLISGILGEVPAATIIFIIVLLSVFLDVYQESKAQQSAELLRKKVLTTATVVRDGARKEVSLTDVVPGDILYLSAGDVVPADSRIINSKDLYADQSALTGESFPVEKFPTPRYDKE